ncbi:hypothetical protein LSH36_6g15020 [Paralvinella palmiformis]|uniref:Uncharacterized protein n=1 Tax=Paralvinella palmiformis TaxID=53620 RepID=A0AAD9KFP1_9ANNE|nr:hypothetical protein LSH36_6g15020 [Paralvinella palmiformis]
MEAQNIINICRVEHPSTRQCTWRKRNPYPIHSSLDIFLVSDSIQGCVECSSIGRCYKTDHSLININCCFVDLEWRPDYWKLHCSLLIDPEYVNLISAVIKQYGLIPDLNWEILKMECIETRYILLMSFTMKPTYWIEI